MKQEEHNKPRSQERLLAIRCARGERTHEDESGTDAWARHYIGGFAADDCNLAHGPVGRWSIRSRRPGACRRTGRRFSGSDCYRRYRITDASESPSDCFDWAVAAGCVLLCQLHDRTVSFA